jgi:hypothetical protein
MKFSAPHNAQKIRLSAISSLLIGISSQQSIALLQAGHLISDFISRAKALPA